MIAAILADLEERADEIRCPATLDECTDMSLDAMSPAQPAGSPSPRGERQHREHRPRGWRQAQYAARGAR